MTEKRFIDCFEGIEDRWETVEENKYTPCTKDGFQDLCDMLNELNDENYKIKSLLLKKVEELHDTYDKCARAGMPTGGIIGELDSFEEICRIMGWIE